MDKSGLNGSHPNDIGDKGSRCEQFIFTIILHLIVVVVVESRRIWQALIPGPYKRQVVREDH